MKINKFLKITLDSMLLVFLLAILIYPATTFGWLKVKAPTSSKNVNVDVLPASTSRQELTETEKEMYRQALMDIEQLIESSETTNPTNY